MHIFAPEGKQDRKPLKSRSHEKQDEAYSNRRGAGRRCTPCLLREQAGCRRGREPERFAGVGRQREGLADQCRVRGHQRHLGEPRADQVAREPDHRGWGVGGRPPSRRGDRQRHQGHRPAAAGEPREDRVAATFGGPAAQGQSAYRRSGEDDRRHEQAAGGEEGRGGAAARESRPDGRRGEEPDRGGGCPQRRGREPERREGRVAEPAQHGLLHRGGREGVARRADHQQAGIHRTDADRRTEQQFRQLHDGRFAPAVGGPCRTEEGDARHFASRGVVRTGDRREQGRRETDHHRSRAVLGVFENSDH